MDPINSKAFILRYSNPKESFRLANLALIEAVEKNDALKKAYATTNKFFSDIILSNHPLDIEGQIQSHSEFIEKGEIIGKVISATYLAIHYEGIAQFTRAMKYLSVAFADLDGLNDEIKSQVYSTAGSIYSKMGQYEKAIKFQERSLKLRLSSNDKAGTAASHNQIGRTLSLLGKKEKALSHYHESLKIREELGQDGALAWTYLGIGALQVLNAEYLEAIESLQKGLKLVSDSDPRCKAHLLVSIGEAYCKARQFESAIQAINESLVIADKLKAEDIYLSTLKMQAEVHEEKGDHSESLKWWKQYFINNEKIQNNESIQRTSQLELSLEAEFAVRRAKELKAKNDELDEKNNKITSSINYASVIQKAILPRENDISAVLPESFVVYRPKDIVSGDFYWIAEIEDKVLIAVGDCTGHGVPGALMSMIGTDQLNHIVFESNTVIPSKILEQMHKRTKRVLGQDDDQLISNDSMELSICLIDMKGCKLIYSGANRPLVYSISNNATTSMIQINPTKMAVGGIRYRDDVFVDHEIEFTSGQCFYMFSDGVQDQFDQSLKYKFSRKRLHFLLSGIADLKMSEQKEIITQTLDEWQGNQEQTDDIVIFGFRL